MPPSTHTHTTLTILPIVHSQTPVFEDYLYSSVQPAGLGPLSFLHPISFEELETGS